MNIESYVSLNKKLNCSNNIFSYALEPVESADMQSLLSIAFLLDVRSLGSLSECLAPFVFTDTISSSLHGVRRYTDNVPLKLDNPPHRDTAMLPASGYLVMTYAMSHWYVFLFICNQIAVLTSTQAGTYPKDLRCSSWSSMTRLQG